MYEPDEMDVQAEVEEVAAPKEEPAITNPDALTVTNDEMEEYASKQHDKAGAEKLFTETKSIYDTKPAAPQGGASEQNTGPHALSDKNIFKPSDAGKKDVGSGVP